MSINRPDPVVAKRLLICDRIERRSDGGVNLINLWLLKRLPKGWNSNTILPPWAAFAWLTIGRGKVKVRLDIAAQPPDDEPIPVWRSPMQEVVFLTPIETQFLCISVTDLRIDAAGDYLVELYCEDELGNGYFLEDMLVSLVE